ncbi:MAG: septum formation initiator family protein [Syntrophales bacterium]
MKVGTCLIIIALLVGLLVTFGDRGLVDNFRMEERLLALKKINSDLVKESNELQRNNSLLRDNLAYIELVAKSELGMVKKGTVVFQFDN